MIILLVIVNMISGCGIRGVQEASTNLEAAAGDQMEKSIVSYPITIKHAFGESIIGSEPSRVVAISQGNVDVALALGVVPVGMFKENYGKFAGINGFKQLS